MPTTVAALFAVIGIVAAAAQASGRLRRLVTLGFACAFRARDQWRGRGFFNRLLEILSLPVREQL
jgi:hypothetical protein